MAWYQVNPLEILDTTNSTGVGTGGSLTVGGGVAVGGDAYFGGNINVSGTAASFADNILILNSGATTSQDTGLLLERASTDVSAGNNYSALVYSESADEFRFGYATSDTRGTVTLNSYIPIRARNIYGEDALLDNISVGNINFNALYQNGVPYIGSSQWTTTSGNTLSYTSGNVILSQQLSANNNSNTLGNIFTTNGNVGIGTTAPSSTLDVSGTVNITTSITTGALYTTNITSTNMVSTNLTSTNVISTNVTSVNIIGMNITGANVFVDNIVISRATMSNVELSHMTVSNMISSHQTIGSALVLDKLTATSNNNTIGNLFTTGGNVGIGTTAPTSTLDVTGTINATTSLTTGAIYSSNVTSTNIVGTNVSSSSLQVSNANITTGTIPTLVNTNAVSTNISSGTLNLSTGITSASAQVTNLNATNTTLGTFVASSGTVGGHLVPSTNITYDLGSSTLRWRDLYLSGNTIYLGDKTLSVANDTFNIANIAATMANLTTSSIGTLVNTNTVSTNISSSTLTLSTGITSASAQVTNLNVTTATAATLVNTNTVTTNVSSATLTLSTGITSASAKVTNLNATILTSGNVYITDTTVAYGFSSAASIISAGGASFRNMWLAGAAGSSTGSTPNQYTPLVLGWNSGNPQIAFQRGDGGANTIIMGVNAQAQFYLQNNSGISSGGLLFQTSNAKPMYFTGGNVGINVSNPAFSLDVNGTLNVSTGVTTPSAQITNLNATTATVPTLLNTNAVSTNISSGTLTLSTGITSASAQVTNLNATTATVPTLLNTNAVSTNISSGTMTLSTGITSASAQVTNLNATTATVPTLLNTNSVSTNISSGTLTLSTGITSASIQVTNLNATTATVPTLLNTNAVSTNISSGTLNLSTGVTSASVQATNINATTITTGTLRNTNAITTNISSGTINLSTGITSASIQSTNLNSTNIVATNITSSILTTSTVSSNVVSSTTFTGSNLSLSGNLNVAGTLTTVNITSTNLVNTNVSAGIVVASSSLSATGNSNTIGNIFTTGGNVGVGIGPASRLNVGGDLTISNSTAKISFNNQINSGSYGYIQHDNTNFIINSINAAPITLYTNNIERLRINTSGNVGIGTTSPVFTLDVTGTIDASTYITSGALYSTNQTTTNIVTTNLNATTGTIPTLLNTNMVSTNISSSTLTLSTGLTSSSIQVTNINATTETIGTSRVTTSLLALGNSNTLGNIFTTGGNVGLGTTSPSNTLDITGTARVTTSITTAALYSTNQTTTNIVGTNLTVTNLLNTNISSSTLNLSTGITTASAQVTNMNVTTATAGTLRNTNIISSGITASNLSLNATGTALDIRAAASVNMNLQNTSSGSSQTKIHSHSDTRTYFQSSGDIVFAGIDSTSVRGLCLRTSGNIGIGTTNPGYTLDVNGTCKVTNELYIANASAGATIFLGGGISGDVGYENSVIQTRNYASTENTELLLFKGNDVVGGSGPDRIRLRAGTIMFDTYSSATTNRTAENIRMTIYDNGNVGIGTTAPAYTLDVTGDARANSLIINGSGAYTYGTIYKDANWGMLFRSGTNNPSLATFSFADYNDAKLMTIDSRGNVGIGTSVPSYKLHVAGDIYATGDVTAYSDARLKTNIKTIDSALDKVDKLRGVYYTHIETQKDSIGLIAQETLDVLPEVVATKGEYLGINYGNIVGLLVEAIKELRQELKNKTG